MQRRDFHKTAVSTALLTLFSLAGCGGGGGGGDGSAAPAPAPSGAAPPSPAPSPGGGRAVEPEPGTPQRVAMGTNFSGMEWAEGGLRRTPNTQPNVHYTVPRAAEIAYMAANGFGRNRLPIRWEMLQPMLSDTRANAQARAMIGEPGAFHEGYARHITGVLDAHAAVGSRCIIDLHNYARYKDFRFQADGSVIGLTRPGDPLLHAYSTDPAQVWERIFATAPGASLSPAAFADFWSRAAARWKDHPGFGGYGLMNEPHDLPRPGQVTESQNFEDDLHIWPVFARAGIAAIRAVDPNGTIYLSGNVWGGAMNIGPQFNPEWPLAGHNIVYEVHAYVDAYNNGAGFDWDLEVAKNFTAGFGEGPVTLDTGVNRMRIATEWARTHGTRIALTETGMPIDDARWHQAFQRLVDHTWQNGWELHSWMGGSHRPIRNYAINHVPGWHQNRTLEPLVAGPMKAAAGIALATLFDDGPGWAVGAPVTITVYARGHLAQPVTLTVLSDGGGTFSKNTLTIPAGPNGQDSYTFTPAADRVTTLSYRSESPAGRQVPPPRKVYSLTDPVGRAGTQLEDAAMALLARYSASKWALADGYTDYVLGRLAGEGEAVRAVSDSGFGSTPGNAMEMVNSLNQDGPGMGPLMPGVMRTGGGRHLDLSAPGAVGLWCRKTIPFATYPRPRNRVPYDLQDPHFSIAVVGLPGSGTSGAVFQAAAPEAPWRSELAFDQNQALARWRDANGQEVVLGGGAALPAGSRAVVALTSQPGRQVLRVNSAVAGSASASFSPSPLGELLIGWGDPHLGAGAAFKGHVYAVVTGRGTPSPAELGVLEQYLHRSG